MRFGLAAIKESVAWMRTEEPPQEMWSSEDFQKMREDMAREKETKLTAMIRDQVVSLIHLDEDQIVAVRRKVQVRYPSMYAGAIDSTIAEVIIAIMEGALVSPERTEEGTTHTAPDTPAP